MTDSKHKAVRPMDLIPRWDGSERPPAPDLDDEEDEEEPTPIDPVTLAQMLGDGAVVLADVTQSVPVEASI